MTFAERPLVAAAVCTVVLLTASCTSDDHRPTAHPSVSIPTYAYGPVRLPPVQITPLRSVGRSGYTVVLARVPAGRSVTVGARIGFTGTQPARVAAVVVLVLPRTGLAVGGVGIDGDLRRYELSRSRAVTVQTPATATVSVDSLPSLTPGVYPVFCLYSSLPPAGPAARRYSYSLVNTGKNLGVVIVT